MGSEGSCAEGQHKDIGVLASGDEDSSSLWRLSSDFPGRGESLSPLQGWVWNCFLLWATLDTPVPGPLDASA